MKRGMYQIVFLAAVLAGMFLGVAVNTGFGHYVSMQLTTVLPGEEPGVNVSFLLLIIGAGLFLCDFVVGIIAGWSGVFMWFFGAVGGVLSMMGYMYMGIPLLIIGELVALLGG